MNDFIFGRNPPPPELAVRVDDNLPGTDEPLLHRWRAWWDKKYDGDVIGIKLQCYPVVRKTPTGAWIDPHAYRLREYREDDSASWEWSQPYKDILRWISDDSGSSWAKPTKELAIASLIYRYQKWANRIAADIRYFMDCGHALRTIYPEHRDMANGRMAAVKDHAVLWPEEKPDPVEELTP